MERFFRFLAFCVVFAAAVTGCTSYDYSSMTLSQSAIYLPAAGQSGTVTFTTYNVTSVTVNSHPEGWDVAVSLSKGTITVTAPSDFDDEDSESEEGGNISITGSGKDDNSTTVYLTVGIASQSVDLSAMQSNCFVVSDHSTIYSFDATRVAETDEYIEPTSVGIVWQSSPIAIAYAALQGNDVEFYVNQDSNDADGDGDKTDVIEGNALIAAYDDDGAILWSWHIWITEAGYGEVEKGDIVLMDRNLGAFANSNSSNSEILRSYGLYYQWGRKEPFVQPSTYNAAGGVSATMLDNSKSSVKITNVATTEDEGTVDYALQNPLSFLLGVAENSYNWLYSYHDTDLWGSTKTIYDPCPKGWRVPDANAFEGLEISENNVLENLKNKYGWQLSYNGSDHLYMGLGRRNYLNGAIQNVNLNIVPEPWVGNYWTIGTGDGNYSSSLYFEYDLEDFDNNTINATLLTPRADGMQLRCQRIE